MNQALLFTDGRNMIMQVIDVLEQKKPIEAIRLLSSQMQLLQEVIMELANGGFVLAEDINQLSLYLVQALENQDSVLLYDVLKYALLDALNQILGISEVVANE